MLDDAEAAVYSPNPWDALGYQAAEEAITLYDGGSPAAAFHFLIEPIRQRGKIVMFQVLAIS